MISPTMYKNEIDAINIYSVLLPVFQIISDGINLEHPTPLEELKIFKTIKYALAVVFYCLMIMSLFYYFDEKSLMDHKARVSHQEANETRTNSTLAATLPLLGVKILNR